MGNEISGVARAHIKLVGELVSAYISNNHVAPNDLPRLIASIHAAIDTIAAGGNAEANTTEPEGVKPTAVKIRRSITPDALISFIDGKGYSTLKRHLTKHGLDPDSYRAQYGLPADYPMVAPSYSERRSALARNFGLRLRVGQNALVEQVDASMPDPKKRKKSS